MAGVRWAMSVSAWRPTEQQLLLATACLQQEEKQRIDRFVFQKDAKASLLGRLLMRKFVAENCPLAYSAIVLARDVKGKPYLASALPDGPTPLFNVSHQGDYVVLAGEVTLPTHHLGVDVMKLEYTGGKRLPEFFRLMERHFSAREWAAIKGGATEKQRLAAFCRHWCLKESYVKGVGTGISVDLRSLSFAVSQDELIQGAVARSTRLTTEFGELADWTFEETLLDAQHCVAVATTVPPLPQPRAFVLLDVESMLRGAEPLLSADPEYCRNFLAKAEKPC